MCFFRVLAYTTWTVKGDGLTETDSLSDLVHHMLMVFLIVGTFFIYFSAPFNLSNSLLFQWVGSEGWGLLASFFKMLAFFGSF